MFLSWNLNPPVDPNYVVKICCVCVYVSYVYVWMNKYSEHSFCIEKEINQKVNIAFSIQICLGEHMLLL